MAGAVRARLPASIEQTFATPGRRGAVRGRGPGRLACVNRRSFGCGRTRRLTTQVRADRPPRRPKPWQRE
jgi:hypothetical protein